ncbi:hypothetical protein N7470_003045 [Penicillium chermesinum]|nr:hypothetical protein N7470_003045 [Penicillium chermesinum]
MGFPNESKLLLQQTSNLGRKTRYTRCCSAWRTEAPDTGRHCSAQQRHREAGEEAISGFFLTAGGSSSSEDHLDIFNSSECAALRLAVPDPGRNFLATVACPGKRTILNF